MLLISHSTAKIRISQLTLKKIATLLKDTIMSTLVTTTEDTKAQLCVATHTHTQQTHKNTAADNVKEHAVNSMQHS